MSCRYDICNLARRTCQLQSRLTLSLLWAASLCCLLGSWNLDMRWVQFQHSRPGWLNMKILQPLVGRSFFSCSVFVQKKNNYTVCLLPKLIFIWIFIGVFIWFHGQWTRYMPWNQMKIPIKSILAMNLWWYFYEQNENENGKLKQKHWFPV